MAREALYPRVQLQKWVYGYTLRAEGYEGLIKVGETTRSVEARVEEQVAAIQMPSKIYEIVWQASAMRSDGTTFRDKDLHRALERMKCKKVEGEWYRCTKEDLQAAYVSVFERRTNEGKRTEHFAMRDEQREAVEQTMAYFKKERQADASRAPRFLWNAKMRFGKTFATYQLAKAMGFKRILILTFKPAVLSAWEEDIRSHIDFEGWAFVRRYDDKTLLTMDEQYEAVKDSEKPLVCFGSFQDFLGVDKETGGIKAKNEWVHKLIWDLVVFDEYHFGAWRERAQQLFAVEDEDAYEDAKRDLDKEVRGNNMDESYLPITTDHYLFLSGTPFRMLTSGEFIEEQIYSWTYTDEQRRKVAWSRAERNPYAALPTMKLLTYQLPESIRRIAEQGERNEFDLNIFFSTEKDAKGKPTFVFEAEVMQWLHFIHGQYLPQAETAVKVGTKPPLPYADANLMSVLEHTLWFLPDVASCQAMAALLKRHPFFKKNYKVILCAGKEVGCGVKALEPVLEAMDNPLQTRTITLSCGKLTTGVTVRPWGGIFMLRNLKSPETYFQAAFRVQSPWVTTGEDGEPFIIKEVCYVLDFAPNRALRQIAEYSEKLTINETGHSTPETRINEFINFLPILYYNGVDMRKIDANEVLDIALSGTSATLLARRWESALLVNVDNLTLQRVMDNALAMEVIQKIEGFRNLNKSDLEILVNKTDAIKQAKREGKKLSAKEKARLTDEEKEYKSKRKQIQEKLVKFATRIPIFMYLTDDREHTLKEVIRQVETDLFVRVTGITLKDFDLLISLGLFSERLMNSAVLNFKRYEDASLSYSGINRHADERVIGAWDTAITVDPSLK